MTDPDKVREAIEKMRFYRQQEQALRVPELTATRCGNLLADRVEELEAENHQLSNEIAITEAERNQARSALQAVREAYDGAVSQCLGAEDCRDTLLSVIEMHVLPLTDDRKGDDDYGSSFCR